MSLSNIKVTYNAPGGKVFRWAQHCLRWLKTRLVRLSLGEMELSSLYSVPQRVCRTSSVRIRNPFHIGWVKQSCLTGIS